MESRIYTPEDYDILLDWATQRNVAPVPKEILPKLCLMVWEDSDPLAFTALYMDNSISVALMIWTATNPQNKPKENGRALDYLIGAAKHVLSDQGYTMSLAVTGVDSLAKFMCNRGFNELETAHLMIGAT